MTMIQAGKTAGLKTAGVVVLALSLTACGTMKTGRDRIVRASTACSDQTVEIYFETMSVELTREGQAVLKAAAQSAKSCKITGVDVLGLADAIGAPDVSLDLSKKRAQAVTAALTAAGLPAAEFKVSAAGQTGAMTRGGQSKPLRRRAEVVLHLSPL